MNETSLSLRDQIAEVTEMRSLIVNKKTELISELDDLNTFFRLNKRLSASQYQESLKRQNDVRTQIRKYDIQLNHIKAQLLRLNTILNQVQVENSSKAKNTDALKEALESLRDKYIEFGSDNTRVSSMRLMATQFAREIEVLLSGKTKWDKDE